MSKSRIGKSSLFPNVSTPTEPASVTTSNPDNGSEQQQPIAIAPEAPKGTGPRKHYEPWKKVTVLLLNRHIVFLDRIALDIATNTGESISRAEILRAMSDALRESGVDLTKATSEEEMKNILIQRLKG